MSAQTNRTLVLQFYKLMSEQRFDEMFGLMSDDATWTVAGRPEHFHHAGVSTKPQRAQGFAGFVKVFASLEMDVRSTTAEDDRVALEAWTRCRTHTGLVYENEMLMLVRCKDDRILSIYEQLDPFRTLEFERKLHESLKQNAPIERHI